MEKIQSKMGDKFLVLLFTCIFLISVVNATENTYCCEKTTDGATCQNIDENQVSSMCSNSAGISETSCKSTSYCKTGTCVSPTTGQCTTSPKATCQEAGGTFFDQSISQVSYCQKGCCLLGNVNALFKTATECSYIATRLGVMYDFLSISDEIECLSQINSDEMGACVTENAVGSRDCLLTTRGNCGGNEGIIGKNETGKTFYAGYLCSAESLATKCIKQYTTGCNKENGMETNDVYWYDSCGNRENVIAEYVESGKDSISHNGGKIMSNVSSGFIGDCDYYAGTQCAMLTENDNSESATRLYNKYSNVQHYCKSTSCSVNGVEYKNGESWCGTDENAVNNPLLSIDNSLFTNDSIGNSLDLVGQEYYIYKCIQGNLTKETCDTGRKEVCIEAIQNVNWNDDLIGYHTGKCISNAYIDCLQQTNEYECTNTYQRFCRWMNISENNVLRETESILNLYGTTIDLGKQDNEGADAFKGVCLPMYVIGDDNAKNCGSVQVSCNVIYERGWWRGIGNWFRSWGDKDRENLEDENYKIINNEECINNPEWMKSANEICVAAGDCGFYANINKNISIIDSMGFAHTGEIYDVNYSKVESYSKLNDWVNQKIQ